MTISLRWLGAMAFATWASGGAAADPLQTIGANNTLVTVNSTTPGTIANSVTVSGVAAGTTLRGIDYRPASPRVLYAISNVGQLYAINSRLGAATAVGAPAFAPVSAIGFDFNPTVDRIRVITQVGQNVRINPDSGALAATDGQLAYAAGDASAGQIPTAAGAAYTNSVAGATSTTLYLIDTRGGLAPARLVTQGNLAGTVSPNTGTLFTVGSLGVTSASSVGFDIARDGTAYATLTNPTTGVTSLYQVNLTTGAATLIGAIGANTTYNGLAVQLASFSSMGITANQARVGAVLDNFTGLPSGRVLSLFNGIDGVYATPGAQAAALQALSPAAYSSLPDLSLNAVEVQEAGILRYTRDLRRNAGLADGGTIAAGPDHRIGAWITGGSRYGHFDRGTDRPRVRSSDAHVLGGIDYRLVPKTAIGVMGGYSQLDARLASAGSHGDLRSWFGGGYATASVGILHVDAWGSYTHLRWGLVRDVAFGSFSDMNGARTRGRVWSGGGAIGADLAYKTIDIEPFAQVRYSDVLIDGFSEAGGASALAIGKFGRTSLRSEVGARAGTRFDLAGASFHPQVRGGWYREFRNTPRTINAVFLDPSISTPFQFVTNPLGRTYYDAGATLNIAGSGPLSMVADYDVQVGRDRRYSTATIGLRLAI